MKQRKRGWMIRCEYDGDGDWCHRWWLRHGVEKAATLRRSTNIFIYLIAVQRLIREYFNYTRAARILVEGLRENQRPSTGWWKNPSHVYKDTTHTRIQTYSTITSKTLFHGLKCSSEKKGFRKINRPITLFDLC